MTLTGLILNHGPLTKGSKCIWGAWCTPADHMNTHSSWDGEGSIQATMDSTCPGPPNLVAQVGALETSSQSAQLI